jgi:hypothetical protein
VHVGNSFAQLIFPAAEIAVRKAKKSDVSGRDVPAVCDYIPI